MQVKEAIKLKNSLDDVGKIFNQKNIFKGKTGIFEIKDNKFFI